LDDEAAIGKLEQVYFMTLNDVKNGRQIQDSWLKEHGRSMSARWTVATAATVGGADWPDPAEWGEATQKMSTAYQMLRESRWDVMKKKGETLSNDARAAAIPLDAKRVQTIVEILQEGANSTDHCFDRLKRFLKDTDTGASRTVTGLKVTAATGAVAATVLTGGVAAELGLGFAGTTTLVGLGGGTYAAGQNLAGQGGEIAFGDRTGIAWGEVAKEGVKGAAASAAGVVGGAAVGKLARPLAQGLGKLIRPGAVAAADAVAAKAGAQGVAIKTTGRAAGLVGRALVWLGLREERIIVQKYTQEGIKELQDKVIIKLVPPALKEQYGKGAFQQWALQIFGPGGRNALNQMGRSAEKITELGLDVKKATVLRDFFRAIEVSGFGGNTPGERVQLLNHIIEKLQNAR
jgi:hypothetical protein